MNEPRRDTPSKMSREKSTAFPAPGSKSEDSAAPDHAILKLLRELGGDLVPAGNQNAQRLKRPVIGHCRRSDDVSACRHPSVCIDCGQHLYANHRGRC